MAVKKSFQEINEKIRKKINELINMIKNLPQKILRQQRNTVLNLILIPAELSGLILRPSQGV